MNSIREFWVIDFDRCLGNVETLYSLFESILISTVKVDIPALAKKRREVELSGGSFYVLPYVKTLFADEATYERFCETFLTEARKNHRDFALPGAWELLADLDARQIPYCIMTYGNRDWQMLKILAAGFQDIPCLVVGDSRKGRVIAVWQTGDSFHIPPQLSPNGVPLIANEVVLVDDKAVSFEGLPAGARGYWVHQTLIPAQVGNVSKWVVELGSLNELRYVLKSVD